MSVWSHFLTSVSNVCLGGGECLDSIAVDNICLTKYSDLHIWHAGSPRHYLGQVRRSRSQVKVRGHKRKNVESDGFLMGYFLSCLLFSTEVPTTKRLS